MGNTVSGSGTLKNIPEAPTDKPSSGGVSKTGGDPLKAAEMSGKPVMADVGTETKSPKLVDKLENAIGQIKEFFERHPTLNGFLEGLVSALLFALERISDALIQRATDEINKKADKVVESIMGEPKTEPQEEIQEALNKFKQEVNKLRVSGQITAEDEAQADEFIKELEEQLGTSKKVETE
ncbi:MAG: hypothetical protein LBG98_02310 [Puniceicoccales bacterium]|jgi:flavorubredoxin|nr:hypothetical protein [Puniceicoccales bacterium]